MFHKKLRVSTLAIEGALKVSKMTKFPALIGEDELGELFQYLNDKIGNFRIYRVHGIFPENEIEISKNHFLEMYSHYVQILKRGETPSSEEFLPNLSTVFSLTPDVLYMIALKEGKAIVKPSKPIIQVQLNHIRYSSQDGEFRSMVYGQGSIGWGLQWTYPHLYQDPKTHEIKKIVESEEFPNTVLFRALQKWMRIATVPTPFIVQDKRINVPFRLGKNCFSWINNHSQLLEHQIQVLAKKND